MLAELRTYTLMPGSRDAMLRQFQEVSIPIFEDIGLTVHGPWIRELPKGEQFVYIAEFDDDEDRQRKWSSFREDPRWVAVQAAAMPPLMASMETVELTR